MKKILSFYITLENKVFGSKVNANRYFATILILFCLLLGAITTMSSFFGKNPTVTDSIIIGSLQLLGFAIAESIMVSDTAGTAVKRALLLCGLMLAALIVGVLTSIVAVFIAALFIFAFLLNIIFGSGLKVSVRDNDGRKHTLTDMGLMGHVDESGHTYEKTGPDTFTRKD